MLNKDKHCFESILDSISRIQDYVKEFDDPDSFYNDFKTFDATMINFVVIGEMISKISKRTRLDNPQIEWNKIKGFRNILAHAKQDNGHNIIAYRNTRYNVSMSLPNRVFVRNIAYCNTR